MKFFEKKVRILLVSPASPASYWGFQESAWFVGAKAAHIPLPLITLAALLPHDWQIRLVDMNIEKLRDRDIAWADAVMVTGMIVHKEAMKEIFDRCAALKVPTIAGGPFVSSSPEAAELAGASALVIGEAEDSEIIDRLVNDIRAGALQRRYTASGRPEMDLSPVPRYDLLRRRAYCAMAIQVSRGCPHRCEFCNVRMLFGRRPRYKTPAQVAAELEAIYRTGFRGNVFFVDDNFIGDIKAAAEVLRAISDWQRQRGYPFLFYTEADVRLADNDGMIRQMVEAGFFAVFTGFESPSKEALIETAKTQNLRVDPIEAVSRLRAGGLLVYGGFIVGFDADGPDIFGQTSAFVEDCRIDFAMTGMLIAIPGTPLEQRLKAEGRLLFETSGDAFDTTNIEPKRMSRLELLRGYRWLLKRLYDPKSFFNRAYAAIAEWRRGPKRRTTAREYLAVIRSVIRQGIFSLYSPHYWRFMLRTLFRCPSKLGRAFATAISGHHFFRYTRRVVIPKLVEAEKRLLAEGSGQPTIR